MTIIGITGGTGAGKTTALSVLEEFGALIIDCDAVYHELTRTSAKLKSELDTRFPGVIADGKLDRKALGKIVFTDKSALHDLNEITHRHVGNEVDRLLAQWGENGGTLAAVDAIALIESGLSSMCDLTVAVTAPSEVRAARIMAREGISREYALMRINAQQPDKFFRDNCTYVLVNDFDTADEFKAKCSDFFTSILGGTHDGR